MIKKIIVAMSALIALLVGFLLWRGSPQQRRVDFDAPTPRIVLEREMKEACAELDKRQVAFDRRFPTEESQKDNNEVLGSKEWKELQDWTEGCNQAKAALEEAK